MLLFGLSQHVGLAEDVLDHRLNCRTIYLNPVARFLYWNMNYHTEHHIFPMVPFHALEKLHHSIKEQLPEPYPNLFSAYREIVPTLLRQRKDPNYFVQRTLPQSIRTSQTQQDLIATTEEPSLIFSRRDTHHLEIQNFVEFAINTSMKAFYRDKEFALYRNQDGRYYASDGICTHGHYSLADGFLKGDEVECPKHNGRFSIISGKATRSPACVDLKVYPVQHVAQSLILEFPESEEAQEMQTEEITVVGTRNLSPTLKEIAFMRPKTWRHRAGQYVQFSIPSYPLRDFRVKAAENLNRPEEHIYYAKNLKALTANYSIASHEEDSILRLVIRLALPANCQTSSGISYAGRASSYMHGLKVGDSIRAGKPQGSFTLQSSRREKVFVGGGAGMAPLKAQILQLLLVENFSGPVSLWFGVRDKTDAIYFEEFLDLSEKFSNFTVHYSLSRERDEQFHFGYIHQVLNRFFQDKTERARAAEFYVCGPDALAESIKSLLQDKYDINERVYFDTF